MVHEFTFAETPTKLPVNTIGAYNGHSAMTFAWAKGLREYDSTKNSITLMTVINL